MSTPKAQWQVVHDEEFVYIQVLDSSGVPRTVALFRPEVGYKVAQAITIKCIQVEEARKK